MNRRTKIVATLGPTTDDPGMLERVIRAGVDVARINFSHGDPEEHRRRIRDFREVSAKLGKVTAVLADLPGPKLRCKHTMPVELNVGDTVRFARTETPAHEDEIPITEPECLADVAAGQRILLDDGRLQLEALGKDEDCLMARVVVGGTLKPNKGFNLPDTPLSIAAVTDRDREAIAVAASAKVDWLALSFVRGPKAAEELRAIAKESGFEGPVLAKLERPEAVTRAAAIIAAFDGVMVARGDLGVEIPLEQVPVVQKQLIAEARAAGKPVITATDMMDSMRFNPRPTRAEASDVANAIFDGTDAVMLSGETAVGGFPVEAVSTMARIAEVTEQHLRQIGREVADFTYAPSVHDPDDPLALSACSLAREVGAAAIITPTLTGRTPRLLARHRPGMRIVAPATTEEVLQRMAIVWGLQPVRMRWLAHGQDRIEASVRDSFRAGAIKEDDVVVVLAGHPIEGGKRYPTVRIVRVGENGSSLEL